MKEASRRVPVWAWLAVAMGVSARAWFAGTSGIYLDEAQVLGLSSQPDLHALLGFLGNHEAHPPGYYLLLGAWLGAFGPSDTAAVALSLVAGTAAILVTYFFVARATDSSGDGTAAAWLVALSPTAVRYSGMVRPYALLSLVIVLALWSLLGFLRSGAWRLGLGYAACGLVLVYTHNWSWLVLGAAGILSLVWLRLHRAPMERAARLLGIHGLIVVLFLPWLPSLLKQISGAGHFFVKGIGATLAEVTWVLTGLPLKLALLVAAALIILIVAHRRAGAPLTRIGTALIGLSLGTIAVTTALALALSPLTPLLISQCYAMLTPALMAALAVGIGLDRPPVLLSRLVLMVFLVAFCGRIAVMSQWVRSDVREIGLFLQGRVDPTDLVLIYPDYPAPTLSRYFTPTGEVFTYAKPGLPSVIPFDRRSARDADRAAVDSMKSEISRVAGAGRRIWYLTIENPSDYPPLRFEVEGVLESQLGPPTCLFVGSTRPRLYEDMQVVLYGGGDRTGSVPPCE